jgi:hypothetical protein
VLADETNNYALPVFVPIEGKANGVAWVLIGASPDVLVQPIGFAVVFGGVPMPVLAIVYRRVVLVAFVPPPAGPAN